MKTSRMTLGTQSLHKWTARDRLRDGEGREEVGTDEVGDKEGEPAEEEGADDDAQRLCALLVLLVEVTPFLDGRLLNK